MQRRRLGSLELPLAEIIFYFVIIGEPERKKSWKDLIRFICRVVIEAARNRNNIPRDFCHVFLMRSPGYIKRIYISNDDKKTQAQFSTADQGAEGKY